MRKRYTHVSDRPICESRYCIWSGKLSLSLYHSDQLLTTKSEIRKTLNTNRPSWSSTPSHSFSFILLPTPVSPSFPRISHILRPSIQHIKRRPYQHAVRFMPRPCSPSGGRRPAPLLPLEAGGETNAHIYRAHGCGRRNIGGPLIESVFGGAPGRCSKTVGLREAFDDRRTSEAGSGPAATREERNRTSRIYWSYDGYFEHLDRFSWLCCSGVISFNGILSHSDVHDKCIWLNNAIWKGKPH